MEITFQRPKLEPLFQAEIYRAKQRDEEIYRVVIGREGTECPPKVGKFIDYHAISDFMNRTGIDSWIGGQVRELKKAGKKVSFDESPSYVMARAIEELVAESPINKD